MVSILRDTPKVNNIIEAKSLLNQAYDQSYGVFDHISQARIDEDIKASAALKRPLAEVAYQQSEDVCVRSELYRTIKEFKQRKINQYFGLSLIEFLNLPVDICEYIMELSGSQVENDVKNQTDVLKDLNENLSNLGNN